jgi:hypothetical protein
VNESGTGGELREGTAKWAIAQIRTDAVIAFGEGFAVGVSAMDATLRRPLPLRRSRRPPLPPIPGVPAAEPQTGQRLRRTLRSAMRFRTPRVIELWIWIIELIAAEQARSLLHSHGTLKIAHHGGRRRMQRRLQF